MRSFNALGLGLVALAGFGACSDGGNTADAPGKKVNLNVAPLSLPGIGDACYNIQVTAPGGDIVWSQGVGVTTSTNVTAAKTDGSLCASQFGNAAGGDIAYVGPCDASGTGVNNVTLWVENLYQANGDQLDPGEWDNPYPNTGSGNTYSFNCVENADVSVVFNIVIMRDANQGFFDVAVNFANIFCSGKLDTCNDAGDINLLFTAGGGAGGAGVRTKTAVLAFACTGGTEDAGIFSSVLYATDMNLTCADDPNGHIFQWTGAEGNQQVANATSGLIQWAVYRTTEQLDCGDGAGSCNKLSWSAAFALDPSKTGGNNCTISTKFTAGSPDDPALVFGTNPYGTPLQTRYPVITVAAPLTLNGGWVDDDANATNGSCIKAGLENTGRVAVGYTETSGDCFDNKYETDATPNDGSPATHAATSCN